MTEQLLTITGLEFTENGRTVARGVVIREGEYDLPALLKAGGAQMGALRPMSGCPTGRAEAKLAGRAVSVVFFGERFLLAAEDTPKADWLTSLRRLVAAR